MKETIKGWAIMSKRGFETAEKTKSRANSLKGEANWIIPCIITLTPPLEETK